MHCSITIDLSNDGIMVSFQEAQNMLSQETIFTYLAEHVIICVVY